MGPTSSTSAPPSLDRVFGQPKFPTKNEDFAALLNVMNRTMCQSNTAIPFANRSDHHPLFFHGVLNIPLRLLHRPSRNEPRDPPPRGWSTGAASTRDCRPRPTGTTIESMDVRKSKTTFVLRSLLFFFFAIFKKKPILWGKKKKKKKKKK